MKKIINTTGMICWKNPMAPYIAYTITEFELKKEMNHETLQQALNDALVAYPRMSYSCMTEDGKLYCIENNLPLEVQVAEKPLLPDGDNLNGHLVSVTLWQKRLIVICNHALTDGTGAKIFTSYMMQRYADLIAGTAAPITGPLYDVDLMNEEIDISKLEYPKEFELDPPLSGGISCPQPKHDTIFTTDGFRVSEEGFMNFVKEKKTSPAIALGAIMAKQILNVLPESEAPVIFAIMNNLRIHVGLEKTLTNCINSTDLSLSRQDLQQEDYLETMRATFKRRTTTDYVRYALCCGPEETIESTLVKNTAFGVSYTGKVDGTDYGIVGKNNIYRMVNFMPLIDMKAQDGWFNVSVTYDNFNNPLTDMLKNAFREVGLEIFEETKVVVIPKDGRLSIERR